MNGNESSNEPLPTLAVYNPALLKKEDLIAQFVARRALLDRLVEELRRGGENGKRHHLIVGPRGSGKTMLLRRLRYAIEDDAELSSRWVPLVFPEEQYNVSRLSDLWVNCLDALSDMLERWNRKDEAERLEQRIDELPATDEKRRARAAHDLLIGWAKKENRGLVLLFDNCDLIFDRLKDDHWVIREILSADNHLLFIGATIARIEATYNHEGAFQDFFKIHELRGLNDEETCEALRTLARIRRTPYVTELLERDPGRIRSLNLLAGGNLRTVVVLYQALAQGSDDSIRADLEQLLDQYTPLYKHQFESLSAQSQQVVDALALNWDPSTAADLAGKLRLETNAVSAVLNRLVKDGIVERAPAPPGEKMFFQIAERFFNIWYLMRASRRVRRRLIWLVEFLKMFYGSADLKRYEEAEAVCRKAIELNPKDAGLRMNLGILLGDYLERYVEAEAAYRQAIALKPNEAWSWFHLGRLFVQHLKRYEEAEAACCKAVELAPNEAAIWMFFGEALIRLKKYEEAAVALHKVIELNPNSELANSAWANLGPTLQGSKRYKEAEAACRKAIELKPNESRQWMFLGGLLVDHLKRYEEAEAAIRQAINLAPNDSGQWILLGKLLADHLNRPDEAQDAFRKAVELNEDKAEYRRSLSWRQYLPKELDEAELNSRLSVVMDPDNLDFSRRAACIFIKRGEWDDAVIYARKFISEGDDEFHERNWPDIIGFFHDAVASGHVDDVAALLDETEYGERWRPLRVALQAIAEDDSSCLLRMAPEIRRPAEEIVALLLPVGVRLGSAPKPARARRTLRKKR